MAIEMALRAYKGKVYAIEKKELAVELLKKNKEQFQADNLEIIEGLAPEAMKALEAPTHAFIGGSSCLLYTSRTGGEIYIGVVGPVRTGKSTFVRRFMEIAALPNMEEPLKKEVRDQLPLSGSGKMITTAEPKFIPKEAAKIQIGEDLSAKIRLIDCVGFMAVSYTHLTA